jgi:ATP-dependent RNA helicase SUPV3L1/SUV3
VIGALSPKTRNAQVELYQNGEVDYIVATDAIGMGLNMDVDHVAFAALRKFDGRRIRWLYHQEIGQIAGRAGRYRRDGTFGVTGDAPEMDIDVVAAVEGHAFAPLTAAEWRNAKLDFSSLSGLTRSLAAPPPKPGLKLSDESQDETTLRQLASDELIARRCRDRANLVRLWDVCQTPDFRKTSQEEHTRLIGGMFEHLTQKNRRLPDEWMQGQFAPLDRLEGDIDMLSTRLARVRTLAYVANRGDWLADPAHWQSKTRALEDRLSDTLHQQLMKRFIDRRTSTLLKSLNQRGGPILGGIGADGAVTVEGQRVGTLSGAHFEPERGGSPLEVRVLRGAVERAVAPEIARRLGALAADDDDAFALHAGGRLAWRGVEAGAIVGGGLFAPRVRLLGEFGAAAARERAERRLEAFVVAEAGRRFAALDQLRAAIADGRFKGLARGLAYLLVEHFGVLDRRLGETQIRALSRSERRTLKGLGVRFGAFSLYLPALTTCEARLLGEPFAALARPGWRPAADALTALPHPMPPPEALALRGLRAVGGFAVPAAALERLDALAREADPHAAGAVRATPQLFAALGWKPGQAEQILRGLGFTRAKKGGEHAADLWRKRPTTDAESAQLIASPFAALALVAKPAAARRRARRKSARRRAAAGGANG